MNQYGAAKLGLSPAQVAAISTAMKQFAGKKFDMFADNATPDSMKYRDDIRDSLHAAGMIPGDISYGMIPGVYGGGITIEASEDMIVAARSFADALKPPNKIPLRIRKDVGTDYFNLIIEPNR